MDEKQEIPPSWRMYSSEDHRIILSLPYFSFWPHSFIFTAPFKQKWLSFYTAEHTVKGLH